MGLSEHGSRVYLRMISPKKGSFVDRRFPPHVVPMVNIWVVLGGDYILLTC